ANIIEILTTGMYQDSKIIYREYIQNACDQIDKAEELGILSSRNADSRYPDLGQGEVNIWLKPEDRYIIIEDNATGIKAENFQRTLLNIADSDKIMGQNKGFRGIGRLCGLAYCKRLVFTSRWIDEPIVSIMTCDAHKMLEMINEANTKVKRHSANDVINEITEFSTRPAEESDPKHFFRVELIDINKENEELFGGRDEDNLEQLTDYLSFVAPVPYQANFYYRSEIYAHAKSLNVRIDEYNIKINGEQIFKKYKTHLKTSKGQEDVFGVEFHNFISEDSSLLGWMWFGKTYFRAAIKEEEISRGLRLRKENIQIGDDVTLRNMFTREASRRGNNYFIGEIFAVSRKLIPNSQRSYFNENPVRIDFEHRLKDYFNNTLYYIYRDGSEIDASLNKMKSFNEEIVVFEQKTIDGEFWDVKERDRKKDELKEKAQEAEKIKNKLERKRESSRSILTSEIIERRAKEIPMVAESKIIGNVSNSLQNRNNEYTKNDERIIPKKSKNKFLVHKMFPQASRNDQKLLYEKIDKIFDIIRDSTDKKTAENIINKIKEELE
ncbi:MAG: ATP-binding protein, partial [Defluviitaleaceae bacterium]|nr:ATP-binding protein [Defluviitaleaceae bacterium]